MAARGRPDRRRPGPGARRGGHVQDPTIAPYSGADGRDWAEAKEEHAEALIKRVGSHAAGLSTADILAVRAESPVDVAAHNPFNLGGSCHGGEFVTPSGEVIPGWTQYAPAYRACSYRSNQPPGRVGVRPAGPQCRPAVQRALASTPPR